MPAVLVVAAIPLLIAFLIPRDPWIDEAMLIANLRALSPWQAFSVMPLYEQVASAGYVLGADLFLLASGAIGEIASLRLFSLCTGLAGVALLAATARREGGRCMAVVVMVLALASPALLRYFTEIKHYALDFTVTAAVAFVGQRLARSEARRDLLAFLVVAIIGVFCSFLAVVPIAACLAGAAAARFWPNAPGEGPRPWPAVLRLAALGTLCAALIAAAYFLYYRPVMAFQTAAYPHVYADNFLLARGAGTALGLLADLAGYLSAPVPIVGQALDLAADGGLLGKGAKVVCGVGLVFVAVYAWRTSRFCSISLIVAVALILALNVAGRLPIVSVRHFVFLAPLVLLAIGTAVERAWEKVATSPRRRSAAAAFMLFLAASSVLLATTRARDLQMEEISPLLDIIEAREAALPVWVYFGAQPAARLLGSPAIRQIGVFDSRSDTTSWFVRGGGRSADNMLYMDPAYPEKVADLVGARPAAWLLFSRPRNRDEAAILAALAARSLSCRREGAATDAVLYRCTNPSPQGPATTGHIAP